MDVINQYYEIAAAKAADFYETSGAEAMVNAVWIEGGVEMPEGFLNFGFSLIAIALSVLIIALSWYKFRAEIVNMYEDKAAPVIGSMLAKLPGSASPSPRKSSTPKKSPKKASPTPKKRNATPASMKKSPAKRGKSPAMKKKN